MEDLGNKKLKSIDIFAEDSQDEVEKSDMSDQESFSFSESRKTSNSPLEPEERKESKTPVQAEEKKVTYHTRRSPRYASKSSATINNVKAVKEEVTGKNHDDDGDFHISNEEDHDVTEAALPGEVLMTIKYDKSQEQKSKKDKNSKAKKMMKFKKKKVGRPRKYQVVEIETASNEVSSRKANISIKEEKDTTKEIHYEDKSKTRKHALVEDAVKNELAIKQTPVKRLRGRPRKRKNVVTEFDEKDIEEPTIQKNEIEDEDNFQKNVEIRRPVGRPKKIKSALSPNSKSIESTKIEIEQVEELIHENMQQKRKKKKKRLQCPHCLKLFVRNGFCMHQRKCMKFHAAENKISTADENNMSNISLDEPPMRKQLPPRNRRPVIRLKPNQNKQDDDNDSDSSYKSSSSQEKKKTKSVEKDVTMIDTNSDAAAATVEVTFNEKNNSMIDWQIYYDCKLLQSALDNPEMLMNQGPGLWMLSSNDSEVDLETSEFTNDMIQVKWNELIYGDGVSSAKFEDDIPIKVLTACVASVGVSGLVKESSNLNAKCAALINANWMYSLPSTVDNMEKISEQDSSISIISKYKWKKFSKSPSEKSDPMQTFKSKSCKTLDEAWNEHTNMLRDVIMNKLDANPIIKDDESKKKKNYKHTYSSNHTKGAIAIKKTYVKIGDPRPCIDCCWCGHKLKHFLFCNTTAAEHAALARPSCAACIYLKKLGWKLQVYFKKSNDIHAQTNKHKVLDYRYTDPNGMRHRSMKSFLMLTTDIIVNTPPELISFVPEQDMTKSDSADDMKKLAVLDGESNNDDVSSDPKLEKNHIGAPVKNVLKPLMLPTIIEILDEEEGLSGILKEDKLRILQMRFGTCMDIAAQVLQSLCQG